MLTQTLKAIVPPNARFLVGQEVAQLRTQGPRGALTWNRVLADAWLRERLHRHHYHDLDERELRAARKSDTVFVFGSGASLNALAPEDWQHFSGHDTFGFTGFIYGRWIPIDFHLLRGGIEDSLRWREYAEEFCAAIEDNPYCRDTIFLMQSEFLAHFCNQLIGYRVLRPGRKIFRYHTARGAGAPTRRFHDGLRHIAGTLSDTVNAAVCLGWSQIVLVGVDLYDTRYFWLKPDETYAFDATTGTLVPAEMNRHGHRAGDMHNTARNGIVELMDSWRTVLDRDFGIGLSVYNPRSLLADVMPVYRRA
jgi:hypothetical protein